jgi:ribosomal protein L11 methyltransferase
MSYLTLDIVCPYDFIEIMMAELAEIGFSTFQEKEDETGLIASADEDQDIPVELFQKIFQKYQFAGSFSYKIIIVEKENWNEDWEKNYAPIEVEDKILVRASFHPSKAHFPYEIVVTPKMSFGTGHHETTYQILAFLLDMDLKGLKVLDAGCGTGILGIMAAKKNAQLVHCYDIDEWAVENSIENFDLNDTLSAGSKIWQGDVHSINSIDTYDIILANINRNILMDDISELRKHMNRGAYLLLSGFYEEDIETLLNESEKYALIEKKRSVRNRWAALCLQRNE